jgi:hypothetical protein
MCFACDLLCATSTTKARAGCGDSIEAENRDALTRGASCPSTIIPVVPADGGSVWLRVDVGDADETTRTLGPGYDGIAHGKLPARVAVVVITVCRNYCRVITDSDNLLVAPSPSFRAIARRRCHVVAVDPPRCRMLPTADSPS